MTGANHQVPGLASLLRKLGATLLGTLENRSELLAVEWQEERLRLAELMLRMTALLFLAMMAVILFTATIIFLFPEGARLYVAAAFTLVYLVAAVGAGFGLRSLLLEEPFLETRHQVRQDRAWLDSLK